MVFQSFNLFPQYTAVENVMLAEELIAKEQPDYKNNKTEINKNIRKHAEEREEGEEEKPKIKKPFFPA